ncbi:MAG: asparagine synthase (glutamine-hydrolyzing), partial [Pseudonocardiaceae bacterium]
MCGITGWISFDRDLTGHQVDLDAMTTTLACRGPDAEGSWLDRHAVLGHRRLAVIDIEGGTQPMSVRTDDGTVVITYSGEVYNFTELRGELRRRGHRFRTRSDTEVVLHGYLEWGEAVAERLGGMFAFAIWDTRIEKLVMIRDRMGIKPLFFFPTPDGVLFGSEPKAILAHPLADRAVDLDGLRELFSLTKTPGHAVWCGMREVHPGAVVTVERTGLREHRYWTLQTRGHTDDQRTSIATVRALLDDIVTRQLVADVPRCVLLSGGLDSSVLTALAAARLGAHGEQLSSFAVDFLGQAENFTPDELRGTTPDTPYVHEVATHVGSGHRDIVLDHTALADPAVRRAVVTARDIPSGFGDMDASLYLLFKAIREHSTVALSGEAADEVFGGYAWFHQPQVQAAATFPWIAAYLASPRAQAPNPLNAELTAALELPSYIRDRYASAVAE